MDSDDYLERNIIEILVGEVCKSGVDIVAAGFEREDMDGNHMGYFVPNERIECTGIMGLRRHYQDRTNGMELVYVWGKLYRKEIFKELRFKENIKYEDIELMPKIMMQIQEMVYLPVIGYHYVFRNDSISNNSDNFTDLYKDAFKIWDSHLKLYVECGMKEFERYVSFLICEKIVNHNISNSIPEDCKEWSLKKINENILKAIPAKLRIKRKTRLLFYWLLLESNRKN